MWKLVTILDYHGHIDLAVIELLLREIKKTKEFASLGKITGRRTYAILVECLENIYYHSSLKTAGDKSNLPRISVSEENDRIIIVAGNPVSNESKNKLSRSLDLLNQSDETALRNLHEKILGRAQQPGENGTGLGLIDIAIKSGNKTAYSFSPMADDHFYFELRISLNK